MKKLLCIFGVCTIMLTGCNKQMLDLDYAFKEAWDNMRYHGRD